MPFELPKLELAPGVTKWEGQTFDSRIADTRRVWPGEAAMEGFFIAKLRKPESASAESSDRVFTDRRYGQSVVDARDWLSDRFGLESRPEVWRTKDVDRWIMTPEAAAFNQLPIIRRGLRAAREVRGGFKPTTDYLQLIGKGATRSRIEINAEETRQYLAGQDLARDTDRGYFALAHDGIVFACGLGQGQNIKNQLPVSRRITPR